MSKNNLTKEDMDLAIKELAEISMNYYKNLKDPHSRYIYMKDVFEAFAAMLVSRNVEDLINKYKIEQE